MCRNNAALETRIAAVLARWLAGICTRLEDLLQRRADEQDTAERRRFAAALLSLRPGIEPAETSTSLAQALSLLALLLAAYPALRASLTD